MPPLNLSSIPTIAQLYRSKSTALFKSASQMKDAVNEPSQAFNDTVSLVREDITALDVDAIVNAANSSLMGGGGVDGAIHRAAGPKLKRECAKLNGCETGSAKMTAAYELPSRHVIHAVGPVYGSASAKKKGGHAKLLSGCYQTALKLAHDSNLKSIAFSAISTGVYGYPSGEAAEVVLGTVREYLEETSTHSRRLERIVFCNFAEKDEQAYETHIPTYFPPTDADSKQSAMASNENDGESLDRLTEQLPDVPTEEPKEPEPEGAPAKKRLKLSSDREDTSRDTQEENPDKQSPQEGPAEQDEKHSDQDGKAESESTGMTQAVDDIHIHSQDAHDGKDPSGAHNKPDLDKKDGDEGNRKVKAKGLKNSDTSADETIKEPKQGQEQTINPA